MINSVLATRFCRRSNGKRAIRIRVSEFPEVTQSNADEAIEPIRPQIDSLTQGKRNHRKFLACGWRRRRREAACVDMELFGFQFEHDGTRGA